MILGAVLMSTTSLKVVYDARESSKTAPIWTDCAAEMVTVVPGLVLSLLETVLLAAVSLAVSTRVGMIPNLIVCFTIYVLGHLVPLIVQSSVGKLAIVRFVGRLFATILPVLEHFTIEAAVIGGVPVPWGYLAWAAIYAGLYSAIALLIALVLFQNRDLARGNGRAGRLPSALRRRRSVRVDNLDAFPGKPPARVARDRSVWRVVRIVDRPRDEIRDDTREISNHANAVCEQFHDDSKF